MAKRTYPTDVLTQFQAALEGWKGIDPAMNFGGMVLADIETRLTANRQLSAELDAAEAKLTDLRNKRDDDFLETWDILKRLRAGVKAQFGDDSSQYEMIGGTRLSERKPYAKKQKA